MSGPHTSLGEQLGKESCDRTSDIYIMHKLLSDFVIGTRIRLFSVTSSKTKKLTLENQIAKNDVGSCINQFLTCLFVHKKGIVINPISWWSSYILSCWVQKRKREIFIPMFWSVLKITRFWSWTFLSKKLGFSVETQTPISPSGCYCFPDFPPTWFRPDSSVC